MEDVKNSRGLRLEAERNAKRKLQLDDKTIACALRLEIPALNARYIPHL